MTAPEGVLRAWATPWHDQARRPPRADVPARNVDIRRSGLQAARHQVALPDRRVQARLNVDQGRPSAPADPARLQALTDLYRSRVAVKREFGGLKREWALLPL